MQNNNSLISVIIPVYNGEKYLREAIDSVLTQSYNPLEIIIIDDGSVDNSAKIATEYVSARYFYQENSGLSAALNLGIEKATGDYIAFLDADDIWVEEKLNRQMKALDQNQELDAVFGHHTIFYSNKTGKEKNGIENEKILPAMFKGAMLIRRESFDSVGLFDTSLKLGDFIDWYSRAKEKGLKIMVLSDVVMRRRVHGENQSIRDRSAIKDYLKIVKASLDRQRKNESKE